jgi:hypothetical protein
MILPRKDKDGNSYISYSQHSKWKYSKKDYIKSYFFGEKFEGNAYTDFGSKIGEALENNDFSAFDKKELVILNTITRLDEFEREIKWNLDGFYVMGYIDSNDKDCSILIDYKTGDLNKVSTYEDDKYDQLAIYAGAIEQETGKLPKEAHVELIERTGNAFRGEPLALGKTVVKIPQDISPKKIEQVKKEVIKVATEIADHYSVFNKMNSILI